MLDDIGTKVEEARVAQMLPLPSAMLETSPGNFQWVYILDGGADPQEAAEALERLADAEVTDAGAKDASHVFRLPGSINDKVAVLERNGGQPWSTRITLWEPDRRYTLHEIVERVPRSAETKAKHKTDANRQHYKPNGDHGLDILRRFNMVLGQGSDDGVNIKCPWHGEHSSETSHSATTYWPRKSGKKPGFKCMHGHCDGRGIKDLHGWLCAMDPTFDPRPPDQLRTGVDHARLPTGEADPEGGKAKAHGAVFIRPGDQFADEYQPLVYIIDPVLPKGTLTTITGAGNIGKTALGMLIAAHKANGTVFNGWEVTKGNVLYASAENTTDFRHRYIAMRDNWKDFAESHFHVMTSNERAGLTSNAEAIENYAIDLGFTFDLIVVDTQAAWSPVEEEANNAEQLAYARALRRLCGLAGSPAVLVLSHPIKAPSKAAECRPRGGVAFENETDGNWTLWLNGELVEVAYTRLRVPRWEPFSIRISEIETTSVVDSKGRPLRSVRAEMASADEAKAEKSSHAVKKFKWQQALDILDNTLADFPEQPINRKRYPTAITVTRVERFKAALEWAAIIDGESVDTRRKQWNRIKDDLQTKGHLRIEGNLCWRTGT